MSVHHRLDAEELSDTSLYELYSALGDRDTPRLFQQKFKITTDSDIPTGAANSIDRKTIHFDRIIYQQIMDGEFKATGLEPDQIIAAWCQHEHSEITIVDGDNAVDIYFPAHKRALRREHEVYRFCGQEPEKVEKVFWPALVKCYARPPKKVPLDLWCGPILDNASEQDEEIIARLQKLGVRDAFRRSKYDAHYGIGGAQCGACRHWIGDRAKDLSECAIINGMVRTDRHCDFWLDREKTVKQAAKGDDYEKLSHEAVSYGPGRSNERCRTCRYSDHGSPPHCSLVADPIEPGKWCRLWSDETP